MQKHEENLAARINGNALQPLQGASVTVTDDATGLPASLYSDDGVTPLAQPIITGNEGQYAFYAANGEYTVTFSGTRFATFTRKLIMDDPSDNPSVSAAALAAPTGAALVGAMQTGVGAVPVTLLDAFREHISVSQFGAVGDGATDDSASIQAALNAAALLGGGVVRCLAGKNHIIRTPLSMSGDHVTLDLNKATLTVPELENIATIIITGNFNTVKNGISENKTAETVGDSRSIECTGSDTIIRDMFFKDYTTGSIYLMDADERTQVLNNTFDMPTQGYPVVVFGRDSLIDGNNMLRTNAGVVCVNSAKSCRIVNNKIFNSFEVGIDIIGNSNNPYPPPQNIIIDGNEIIGAGNSAVRVGTSGEGGYYGESVIITNNVIKGFAAEGSGYGVDITGKYSGDLNKPPQLKLVISGNLIEGTPASTFGVSIIHAEGAIISNNVVTNCTIGIGINEGAKSTIVTGNTLTANRGSGINVNLGDVENVAKSIISNNVIYNNGVSAVAQGAGIEVHSGRGVRIINNNIFDRNDGGVQLQGSGVWLKELSTGSVIKENGMWGQVDNIKIDLPRVAGDYTIGPNYNDGGAVLP